MEDHRDRFVVIVAGYTQEINTFIQSNPGLASRFKQYIEFDDYDADALYKTFELKCSKHQFELTADAKHAVKIQFEQRFQLKIEHFGNGREARKFFEQVYEAQAERLMDNLDTELSLITLEDVTATQGLNTPAI